MDPEFNSQDLGQKIWVLNGAENIVNFYISRYDLCKKNIVCCYDFSGPITIKKTAPVWRANLALDKRGIKVRVLTDIRDENLEYCKEIQRNKKYRDTSYGWSRVTSPFMMIERFFLFL